MKEKKKKAKEQPITKLESKKKVNELKKTSQSNKEINLDTKKALEKVEELKHQKKKSESLIKKIRNFFAGILLSFIRLDTSVKLLIIIPTIIILVISGNFIYSMTGTEYLICKYSDNSSIISLEEKLKFEFKRNSIYKLKKTIKYIEQNAKWKSVEELENEVLDKRKENKNVKGFSIDYRKAGKELIVVEEYNYYKLNTDALEKLNLESESTLDEIKKEYETFGYQCESSK